jgi:Caspase domain
MRRALIVGIDQYVGAPLRGCVNDAKRMADLLKTNEDGSPNFECKTLTAPPFNIGRADLKSRIKELFINEADVALLYFSGHGTKNILGGYLVTQDAQQHDEGVPMSDVIALANKSRAQEVVILLDCCHSGALGDLPGAEDKMLLREGVSILTASRGSQVAVEIAGGGVFTSLLCAALEGGASDVLGKVTIGSIYAYVDQSLGAWDQRPLFKALVSKLIPLRTCNPVVPLEILRRLPEYFTSESAEFQLDPSFEPDADPKHPEHEATFRDLQKLRDARLLVAVGAEHMFYAAINSRSCKLTPLGRFHWNLAKAGKL